MSRSSASSLAADNPCSIVEHLLCSRGYLCVVHLYISSKVVVARIARAYRDRVISQKPSLTGRRASRRLCFYLLQAERSRYPGNEPRICSKTFRPRISFRVAVRYSAPLGKSSENSFSAIREDL